MYVVGRVNGMNFLHSNFREGTFCNKRARNDAAGKVIQVGVDRESGKLSFETTNRALGIIRVFIWAPPE